ncbi:hypothetical protein RRH01S_12_00970 [Rhizobium rhizogenes NBRC 13257]|uniref:Transposase n=1 Tax=Rhizobium rhizogenes NBRC 13257 TaxID=1220581 RepID=A0AA87QA57_RHIRH|nr:hypothetical protein RRH01S_12_00970 [Rhizobium rhizogenes NBRC 13257]
MARTAAVQAENCKLTERVVKLEGELHWRGSIVLRRGRLPTKTTPAVGELVDLPDTGFATIEKPEGQKSGGDPLPEYLPRERVEMNLPMSEHDGPIGSCVAKQSDTVTQLSRRLRRRKRTGMGRLVAGWQDIL